MNEPALKTGHYRYRILALVFMATTINYFDRSIIGVMAPTLQKLFSWTNKDYATIMISFKVAYGIGLLFMGGIIDRLGTKTGYLLSIAPGAYSGCFMQLSGRHSAWPDLHPGLSKEELAYINSDSEEETPDKIRWQKVLPKRETWAFALTTVTDAVWWFYLFWGAKFLAEQFGVDIKNIGLPFLVIFIMADAGSLLGGYASGALIKKGWTVNKARKITMLVCALIILPVSFVPVIAEKWLAVFLIGLAAAGHQSWSINGYTLVPDVFPKKAVASVTGIGKMAGVAVAIVVI